MRSLAILIFAAACGSSGPSPAGDASVKKDSASTICMGALYDPCNPANPNCMNGATCKTFNGSSFSVCTQTCSAQMACPNQGTASVTCNNMGICKPLAPNSCMVPP